MATRKATAQWSGGLKGGSGSMALGSGVWEGPFSFKSRFEDDEPTATNPEELIGAAHAGCYSMQLSAMLEAAGTPAESVRTNATVELRAGGDEGPHIASIRLSTTGRVPGIDAAAFEKTAQEAKQACLVTRALAGVKDVSLEVSFEG
jgi:osmotically inducible protein OsmC